MKSIKIGVVEDEMIIAETLIANLNALGYETTEPCITYTAALAMIESEAPDLILLDIQLAGKKTGIDVAKEINANYDTPFIFLTSNSDSATIEAAKKVHPDAYLVKPFNKADLFAAIEIALSNSHQEKSIELSPKVLKDVIFLKKKDKFYSVKIEEIVFIKSDHVYVEIQTLNELFMIRSKLEDFVQKFPSSDFFQAHRRYYVNLTHLKVINSDHLMLLDHQIPLGKSYRTQLMKITNIS